MASLLKVPIDDGEEYIEVEVDWGDLVGPVDLVSDDQGHGAPTAPFSLVSSVDRILPALRTVLHRARSGLELPDEVAMEVAFKVGGETGLIFAKGKTEATFSLTLTWRKTPSLSPVAGVEAADDTREHSRDAA